MRNSECGNAFLYILIAVVMFAGLMFTISRSVENDNPQGEMDESKAKLAANEIIQFRAPNFRTSLTYPAYANYYAVLNTAGTTDAIAAKFLTLKTFFANAPTMWLGTDGIITKKFNSSN